MSNIVLVRKHAVSSFRMIAIGTWRTTKDPSVYGAIEVEIWEMDEASFGSFVAAIPSPLGIGTLTLADGRTVKGFVCEAYAIEGAEDITAFGGWRAWLGRLSSVQPKSRTA